MQRLSPFLVDRIEGIERGKEKNHELSCSVAYTVKNLFNQFSGVGPETNPP